MRAFVLTVALCAATGPVWAGPVERACNASDRQAATRSICACIGQVADQMLTGSDQRRGAKFFRNPDKAQDMRASDSRTSDAFWDRWTAFGEAAESYCSG